MEAVVNAYKSRSKNRRGLRKNKSKQCLKKLIMVGVNSAGLSSKLKSFDHLLNTVQPSVFFIEETKLKTQGKIRSQNCQNYQIFELTRKKKGGGGIAIGALDALNPVWISEGDDDVEVLVIQIEVEQFAIRCIGAYGPQEKDIMERK